MTNTTRDGDFVKDQAHRERIEKGERTVWYILAELNRPVDADQPFAVLSVDVTEKRDGGMVSTIVSLHSVREEAERIVHEFNGGAMS